MSRNRFRLSERVHARRHLVDGEEVVRLLVEDDERVLELDARTWEVLRAADGTRDAIGIALAARRHGAHASEARVEELLGELAGLGLLVAGPPAHAPDVATPRARPHIPADAPIEPLPGFDLRCDGAGRCCRSYDTVVFTPDDLARARATVPGHRVGPVPPERLFTPLRGSAPTPLQTPVIVDGACCFLGDDGRCEIHRRGGLAAKPVGCAAFPSRFCYDGQAIRASAVTECACVLSAQSRGGRTPAIEAVPATAVIDVVPDGVRATTEDALRELPVADPARWAWGSAVVAGDLQPRLRAIAGRLSRRLQRGRARPEVRLLSVAATTLLNDDLLRTLLAESPTDVDEECFYLRANLWAYCGVVDGDVAGALRERAVRIWLSRALAAINDEPHPLATVDAVLRQPGSTGSSGHS